MNHDPSGGSHRSCLGTSVVRAPAYFTRSRVLKSLYVRSYKGGGQFELLGIPFDVGAHQDRLELFRPLWDRVVAQRANDVLDAKRIVPNPYDALYVHKVVSLDDNGAFRLLALNDNKGHRVLVETSRDDRGQRPSTGAPCTESGWYR